MSVLSLANIENQVLGLSSETKEVRPLRVRLGKDKLGPEAEASQITVFASNLQILETKVEDLHQLFFLHILGSVLVTVPILGVLIANLERRQEIGQLRVAHEPVLQDNGLE
jgi:hypothetical protein